MAYFKYLELCGDKEVLSSLFRTMFKVSWMLVHADLS
jgi:hypothetical protein